MTILFENNTTINFDFEYEKIALNVIKQVLEEEKFPHDVEISITFVDEEEIKEINSKFRDINKPTDVLSFPLIEYEELGKYDFIKDDMTLFNPESNEAMLGDIVVCIPKVTSQAKEYGHSEIREFAFLIAHSMLHLLGFDHINDDDRKIMEEKQNKVLDFLKIKRD